MSLPHVDHHVDHEVCLKLAQQCCQYYEGILEQYEERRADPHWHAMHQVAKQWRSVLMDADSAEFQLQEIESAVRLLDAESNCGGTTWDCMSISIDIWLRSKGRAGLGIWHGDVNRYPRTVLPLWSDS